MITAYTFYINFCRDACLSNFLKVKQNMVVSYIQPKFIHKMKYFFEIALDNVLSFTAAKFVMKDIR
jgi:hypothetical protein